MHTAPSRSRQILIFRTELTVILCPVFIFREIRRGLFNILLPGTAPHRRLPPGGGCLSQYFIEIYIAIYYGARDRAAAPRRFADVFWAEVFKFSLRLIMSLPLNRRNRNYDRKARGRNIYYSSLFCGRYAQICMAVSYIMYI